MDWRSFPVLLGLRYRLLWANARTSRGRMALFVVGYLLVLLVALLMGLGGIGAGVAAVRLGQGVLVAQVVFGAVFANAVIASVILGLGLNEAFSDAALRRFPISAANRVWLRHLTALLEPTWALVLAACLGLVVGFAAFGAASLWSGIPLAGALVVTNYLAARALADLVARLLATRAGPIVAFAGILLLGFTPAMLQALGPRGALVRRALAVPARALPSSAAAVALAAPGTTAVAGGWGLLLAWLVVLGGLVWWLDRRPLRGKAVSSARARWDSPIDRLASLAGPATGPLVGKIARYYLRSLQFRFNYPAMLPMVALFVYMGSDHGRTEMRLPAAMGMGALLGMASGAMSLNAFGFDGAGIRRYFLLPVPPSAVVRAAAIVSLLPPLSLLPVALIAWWLFSGVPGDWRTIVLLLSSALTGILAIQAVGLWTSVLSPKAVSLTSMFGNRLSGPANVVMMVTIFSAMLLPQALARRIGGQVEAWWWAAALSGAGAAAAFGWSVRAAGLTFSRRREALIRTIEHGAGHADRLARG